MQENPLVDVPPPNESIAPWWPLIGMVVSLLVAGVSAGFAAWMKYREWQNSREEKLIDKEKEQALQQEQRKQAVEIEELKLTFAARQSQFENLMAQLKTLNDQYHVQLDEGRKMREELAKARVELQERDKTIGELRTTIAEMQVRIKQLEREVDQMEKTQAQHIRASHSTGATSP